MPLLFFLSLLLLAVPGPAQPPCKFVFQQPEMGSLFAVQLCATDSLAAARAAAEAFALADSLNARFSDYLPHSELNRLARAAGTGRWVPLSPDLFAVLQQSKTAWQRSWGTFDVTVGRLTRLWRQSRKSHRLPPPDTLRRARATVGMAHLRLDPRTRAARLDRPGVGLDLGGIGKGYAARAMLALLRSRGFPNALVDAAGNLAAGEAPPLRGQGVAGWRVAVQLPAAGERLIERLLSVQNRGVSTSGDLFQFVEIGGRRYSHIVSPRTGLGLTSRRQVTVLAPDAATADWLSTACCLLPVEKALALLKREGAEGLFLEPVGPRIRVRMTPGFGRFFAPD
jgi:thiamine biosynthesis lipoprotein